MVPVAMVELNEADIALGEAASEQTVVGERRLAGLRAVHLQHLARLAADVHQFGDAGLHPVGHLILADPRGDLGVAESAELKLIEIVNAVEQFPTSLAVDAGRVGDVEDRVARGAELHALMTTCQEPISPVASLE